MVSGIPGSDSRTRYYRQEAEEGSFLSPAYSQAVLRRLCSRIKDAAIECVCDIGSGQGSNLPTLRELFPSASLVALDLNQKSLTVAKCRTTRIAAIQCDVLALPLTSDSADVAVCTEVLEHVASLEEAVREIGRVVRPGGYAVISSPNYLNPMGLRKWFHDRRHGAGHWDPWGGHPGFERLMLPGLVSRAIAPFFNVLQICGGGYFMAWIPLGYRRVGMLSDRFPLLGLGHWPIFRDIAVNRYLLLQKKTSWS